MTETDIRWQRINEWHRKQEFRKKLKKLYPDLGELCEMRHGISEMIVQIKGQLSRLPADIREDDDEYYTLKCNKALLTQVYNRLNKEAKELFEAYGVEDKCAES